MPPRSRVVSFPRPRSPPDQPATLALANQPASPPFTSRKLAVRPFDTLCRRALPICVAALLVAPVAHAADDVPDKDKVTELQGVKVRASAATQSTVATKTDAPLIEVPQSVSVISREELTVRNVQSLSDALNYTAGAASNATGTDQRYDWPYIRGFDASSFGIYQDG